MRKYITILIAMLALTTAQAKPKQGKKEKKVEQKRVVAPKAKQAIAEAGMLYIYGISYSAADSVVYMTDMLMLDKAQINKRNNFLLFRNELSNQLRNHMASKGMPNRTCSVTYSKSLNTTDKNYRKQVELLKKRGYLVRYVNQTEFQFKAVRAED